MAENDLSPQINKYDEVVVFDTNVLLSDARSIYDFENSLILIPRIVMDELDKVKIGKVSASRKYQGREIARIMFDLAGRGSLSKGVELENGSLLQVAARVGASAIDQSNIDLKRSDDQVIATALVAKRSLPDLKVTLLTEDINMLLKAKLFDLEVQRFSGPKENVFIKTYHKKFSFTAVALLWVLIFNLAFVWVNDIKPDFIKKSIPIPRETIYSIKGQVLIDFVNTYPNDFNGWKDLGDLMFEWGNYLISINSNEDAVQKYDAASRYYNQALIINPHSEEVGVDFALSIYNLGRVDEAIKKLLEILKTNPKNLAAQYNYGVFLWEGKGDADLAAIQLQKVLEISDEGEFADLARSLLKELELRPQT